LGVECYVAVIDVDGVLLRQAAAGGWEARRLGIEVVKTLAGMGYSIHIHTGRHPRDRWFVLSILREAGLPLSLVDCIMFREDRRVGEVEWKLWALQEALESEGCVGEIHDDKVEVLEAARRMVSGGVLHWDDSCGLLYGYTGAPQCRRRL
jgi:hypothetical protein